MAHNTKQNKNSLLILFLSSKAACRLTVSNKFNSYNLLISEIFHFSNCKNALIKHN